MDNSEMKAVSKKEEEIKSWVKEYTKELLSWAFYKTSDKMLAEDLVQEVFLVATKNYDSFRHNSQPKTWLFAILNNKIAEHYRKLSARTHIHSISDPFFNADGRWHEETAPQEWPHADEDSLPDNPEFMKVLYHCIDELSALHAACICMKFIHDMESKVICQELGISPTNYWQIIHRAKLQLRKCLEKLWFKQ
ncbi:MAG: RNA polymerase sigma factor [Chitinophagales bacterium]|nr:MAG: RNA polymerase sigma factor [Chitinophagales bacterium]